MERDFALVDDPSFIAHEAPTPHPERPERLHAARRAVESLTPQVRVTTLAARDATDDEIARVHTPRYIEHLGRAAGKSGYFDEDTYYGPRSVAVARRAAGAAVTLVESLLGGTARFGAALVRPPGHHARPDSAMGFCLLNNVAVAAAVARTSGVPRVMVVDFDVHHGNGTQEMFYADPSVLYVSLHQFPFYPGSGSADERGSGDGSGYTVNVPLTVGADDAVYDAAFERVVAPIAEQYAPGLLLLSAGFDAHARDPLAEMNMSERGYAAVVGRLRRALPDVPVGLVLEGGYDLVGLEASLRSSLDALFEQPDAAPALAMASSHERDLAAAAQAASAHWKLG